MAALLLASVSMAGRAQEHRYSFVQAAYVRFEPEHTDLVEASVDDRDAEASGLDVVGSVALNETSYVFAGIRSGNGDVELSAPGGLSLGFDFKLRQYRGGAGVHRALSERTDLVAELEWLRTTIDAPDLGVELEGRDGRVSVGVRHWLGQRVGVWATGHVTHGDLHDGAVSASFGGEYVLARHLGLVVGCEVGGGITLMNAGIRAAF